MSKKIKLIWDFKGMDAQQTAEHHQVHLKEFASREKLVFNEVGVENLNDNHSIAYMNVVEIEVFVVRNALLPHRAEVV